MLDKRARNIAVFEDTEKLCQTDSKLVEAIAMAKEWQYVVYERDELTVPEEHRFCESAKVIVTKHRSLEAAGAYPGERICVHNFASATNPGGGVTKGSNAQEEAICRCSTLYPNINDEKIRNGFHNRHRRLLSEGRLDVTYNDDCVFTPGVIVFKTDTSNPELMPETEWYQVDVITCAAPNLRERPTNAMNPGGGDVPVRLSEQELFELHIKRMRRILNIAKKEKEDVLILGAFGCGAFSNSPRVVARAMEAVIKEFLFDFKVIEFAVFCSPWDTRNFDEFSRRLGGL